MLDKSPIFKYRSHWLAIPAWSVLVLCGFWTMAQYEFSPGMRADMGQWPSGSPIVRAPDRPTLVVFAHPQCPCTRATISELEQAIAQCGDRISARVFFFKPAGSSQDWARTDSWKAADAIAGVSVLEDVDGVEARRFGTATSGQSLLFSVDGRLIFSGGITAARGHIGENDGRAAVISLAEAGSAKLVETPVFGCSLLGQGEPIPKPSIP